MTKSARGTRVNVSDPTIDPACCYGVKVEKTVLLVYLWRSCAARCRSAGRVRGGGGGGGGGRGAAPGGGAAGGGDRPPAAGPRTARCKYAVVAAKNI